MKTIHIVTGQTGTGKTRYAVNLAKKYGGALVNFDARQIYRGLDIVTGKDHNNAVFSSWIRDGHVTIGYYLIDSGIPLWLYDIIEPGVPFSAFEYEQAALPVIDHLLKLHDRVFLVGGSYFYLYNLLYQQATQAAKPDSAWRAVLETKTLEELQQLALSLNEDDYRFLNQSDRNNSHRLIRFIERALHGEKYAAGLRFEPILHIKLKRPPETLRYVFTGFRFEDAGSAKRRIERRILTRLEQGAEDEVRALIQAGYRPEMPGLNSIGYRQLIAYLNGAISRREMISEWLVKERQYAKRQLTFMKRDPHITWHVVP